MAPKTSVVGNKVTIDDFSYTLSPAGANRYSVTDEFGMMLGYFMVTGRVVKPDDYGVEGAHPVLQIGRLWVLAQVEKSAGKAEGPPTKGICRIATHEKPSEADLVKGRAHRAWAKRQPGCKASYFVHDPASGKAMTITIWDTRENLSAYREARPPEGAMPMASTGVETFPVVEEP